MLFLLVSIFVWMRFCKNNCDCVVIGYKKSLYYLITHVNLMRTHVLYESSHALYEPKHALCTYLVLCDLFTGKHTTKKWLIPVNQCSSIDPKKVKVEEPRYVHVERNFNINMIEWMPTSFLQKWSIQHFIYSTFQGKQLEVVCLIPEFCSMTGLTDTIRADFRVMKASHVVFFMKSQKLHYHK